MSGWFLFGLVAALEAVSFGQALEQSARAPLIEAAVAAESARRDLAGHVSTMTHNPVFGVQPGARNMANGGNGFEVYVSLSQRINLAGLGKKRREALARELEQDRAAASVARMNVRRAVAEQWLLRWSAQQAGRVVEGERALAAELLERLETLVRAGEATAIDRASARTWQAEAQLSALDFEDAALGAGVQLARMMGRPPTDPQSVGDDLPEIDLGDEEAVAARARDVRNAPNVVQATALTRADASRLEETRAARGATMAFGVFGWREGGGDVAGVGTLEVDLPVFEHGERERASAAAELERARGNERETAVVAAAERQIWLHDVAHTREVQMVIETQILPAAHEVADGLYKRVQAQEATAQEWVVARRAVLKSELDAIRARAAHVLARFLVAEALHVGEEKKP